MAMNHTRKVERIECFVNGYINVTYVDIFDDPDDDLLPTEARKTIGIMPHSDVSKYDQYVQDVCAGAWTNIAEVVEATDEV